MRHVWLSGFKFRLSTILSNVAGLYWRGALFFFWSHLFFFWAEMWLKQLIFFIHPRAAEKEWQRRTRSICLRFEIRILWRCQGGRGGTKGARGEDEGGVTQTEGRKYCNAWAQRERARQRMWTIEQIWKYNTMSQLQSAPLRQCCNAWTRRIVRRDCLYSKGKAQKLRKFICIDILYKYTNI